MSLELDPHASQLHTNLVQQLSQQRRSRLMKAVTHGSYRGEKVEVVNQYGKRQAQRSNERNGDTPNIKGPKKRRWVSPTKIHDGELIDQQDELDAMFDFGNPTTEAMVSAIHRDMDKLIIEAFFAPAITGQKGTSTTNFPSSNVVLKTVGGNDTPLNVAKLRAAKKILMANEAIGDDDDVPEDMLWMTMSAEDHDGLLGDYQAVSKDFNSAPVLENGKIRHFLGFNFIHTEQTSVTSNTRDNAAWVKDGMHFGTWAPLRSHVAPRPDKQFNIQFYPWTRVGATRTEEEKVIKVQTHQP